VEDWADIRRLHRSEGMPIKAIARVMGVSRNTVRSALRAEGPPRYERAGSGSTVDAVEPRVRELLRAWPDTPATVIAERIGWTRSIRVLRARWLSCGRCICRRIRRRAPAMWLGRSGSTTLVPADRVAGWVWADKDGEAAAGVDDGVRLLAVVIRSLVPTRHAADLFAGWWWQLQALGAVPRVLVWDDEGAVGRWRRPQRTDR
jgi:hypothetical protein